jgi:cytochrome c oxidase cbb3-type subunit III
MGIADQDLIADTMKRAKWISSVAVVAAGVVMAQSPAGQAPKGAAQSPASQPAPKTVTPQMYPIEQIQAGELRFTAECGFCHGRDAAGGETGPDLTRSTLVADDMRGDKIVPMVRAGRPDKGMPAFNLSNADLGAIAAFIHDQKKKFEDVGGGRRSVDAADLATGDAAAGGRYFNGAGGCSGCHPASGDFAKVATRYQGLELLQRMLYAGGRKPEPSRPTVTVTFRSGRTRVAPLASEDEFTIVALEPSGARHAYKKQDVKFKIDNPMSAHFAQLGKYTDADMHNVFAYLNTLK